MEHFRRCFVLGVALGVALTVPKVPVVVAYGGQALETSARSPARPEDRPKFTIEEYQREQRAEEEREAHLSPWDMQLVATLNSPVLQPGVLIQLRNIAPKNPGLLAALFGRRPASLGTTVCLYIMKPGKARRLESIDQLHSLVKIDTPQKALELVRFRTAPDLRGLLGRGYPPEAEVVQVSDARGLPQFGIKADKLPEIDPKAPPEGNAFGDYGLLSDEGFKLGGFAPPRITELPRGRGYVIERWTFRQARRDMSQAPLQNLRNIVSKVRETVGNDGVYSRKVILERDAPKLPHTRWKLIRVFM